MDSMIFDGEFGELIISTRQGDVLRVSLEMASVISELTHGGLLFAFQYRPTHCDDVGNIVGRGDPVTRYLRITKEES